MTSPEMTCQELVELVTDYLEGALPPLERERFEAHLSECEGCANYLMQMRTTVRLVGTLCEEDLDPGPRDALLGAFRDFRRAGSR
jgi:anti-sigma factor RsiW